MREYTLRQFADIVCGTLHGDATFTGIAFDSRKVAPGDLFVCIVGEKVDGHRFIENAQNSGATCYLTTQEIDAEYQYVRVKNPVEALQRFAAYIRNSWTGLFVAVTGSVGKTSTKEMIADVLSEHATTFRSPGNMNSDLGLPVVLSELDANASFAVAEMGMSNLGEISALSRMGRPDIAVITNIGFCHLENLKTRENILKAKLEILDGLSEDGVLVLNGDDEYLKTVSMPRRKILRYGLQAENDVRAENVILSEDSLSFYVSTPVGSMNVSLNLAGIHHVYNAMASICVGITAGLTLAEISSGLKKASSHPIRQQERKICGVSLLEDYYNASPSSMRSSIDVLKRKNGRKIAVLGDMLELGEHSAEYHVEVGNLLNGVHSLIAFGDFAYDYIKGACSAGVVQCVPCNTAQDAATNLTLIAKEGDVILVKASRGMHAEDVVTEFLRLKKVQE